VKIAIIRKKYTFHGGAEGFSSSFIENLANDGHDIHIFAIKWQADARHKNIHFHKVPAITIISFFRDLSFAVSSWFLLKKQRESFDIIQTHDKTLYQDIYRAGDGCHIEWLKQRWKRTSVIRKASIILNPYHWLVLWFERMILKGHRFKKIIAISELVRKNIVNNYGVPSSDIEVIYNGIDTDRFHPDNKEKYRNEVRRKHGLKDDDFVVLFAGSGFERKGLKYLIQAVETIPEPVSLMIVGKGKHPPVSPLAKGGIKGGFVTHGRKTIFCGPQRDIHKYYAAADIFVFPTLYEPFGNVHLEALSSGLPVITTKNSGASEIIKDAVHGFIVEEPEDFKAIAERIRIFVNDRDKLQSMSENARILAEEFTFKKHMGNVLELYKSITAMRG
jgi:UDP-glucose:(heptosyl)LPS alpha-1,3-glucosyltransferase